MTETLPVVGVRMGKRGGNVESISLDFKYAQGLRADALEAFKRALAGNLTGIGECTFEENADPDVHDFLIVLEHPTSDETLLTSLLLEVAAECGYGMWFEAKPREERVSASGSGGFADRGRPSWRRDDAQD